MSRNTSILIGKHFEDFIAEEVKSGRYNSASEVIRAALRLLEQETFKRKQVNKALILGERSGLVKRFKAEEHLVKLQNNLSDEMGLFNEQTGDL